MFFINVISGFFFLLAMRLLIYLTYPLLFIQQSDKQDIYNKAKEKYINLSQI